MSVPHTSAVRRRRSFREYAGIAVRGFCMGAADIVPGVSGGTMAFILGVYEELIESIRTFANRPFLRSVVRLRLREAVAITNWPFLLALGTGILAAILTLSHLLEYLLAEHPFLLWSFFFGLVLASLHVVALRIHRWTVSLLLMFALGTVAAYVFVGLIPIQTPDHPLFLVFSGAVAICAMILPGISGSFLLVLLGKYAFILNAVNTRDILSIAYVGIGAVTGILAFSHVLSWLLRRYHDITMAFLAGLMLGSLRKIWPWKTMSGTAEEANIWPSILSEGSVDGSFLAGIALIGLGFLLVFLLERWAGRAGQR